MQRLIDGVHKFRSDQFGNYRKLFRKLSQEGQNPHTLFITCSDSRVLAELITQSKPGDLFVVKNVGNIVPPTNVSGDTNSTAAAIEFAVESLRVSDVVICGHSQCGAIAALLDKKKFYLQQIDQTQKQYSELTTNPETQEKFAREHYWMKRDNEDVFVLVKHDKTQP